MRALLDVNVLIALLDAQHLHHKPAARWLKDNIRHGWATCPITQNGCLRIMAQPGYPNSVPTSVVAERLREATSTDHHRFWPDEVSLLDPSAADWAQDHRPQTDHGRLSAGPGRSTARPVRYVRRAYRAQHGCRSWRSEPLRDLSRAPFQAIRALRACCTVPNVEGRSGRLGPTSRPAARMRRSGSADVLATRRALTRSLASVFSFASAGG